MYGIGVPHSVRVPALSQNSAAFTVLATDVTVAQPKHPKQNDKDEDDGDEGDVDLSDTDNDDIAVDIRIARRGDVLCAVNDIDVRALGARATRFLVRSNEQSNLGFTLFFTVPSEVDTVHVESNLAMANLTVNHNSGNRPSPNTKRTSSSSTGSPSGVSVATTSSSGSSSTTTWSRFFTRMSGMGSQQPSNDYHGDSTTDGSLNGLEGALDSSAFERLLFRLRAIGEKVDRDIPQALFGSGNVDPTKLSPCARVVAQTLALLCLQFLEISNATDITFTAVPTLGEFTYCICAMCAIDFMYMHVAQFVTHKLEFS
jgi:hypothetical protein